jgi:hypothetical protein
MLKTNIKNLQEQKLDILNRLDSIHDVDADPNVKAVYQSDLQFKLLVIEDAIDFEKRMLPFKYTLVGFAIAVVCMLIYVII